MSEQSASARRGSPTPPKRTTEGLPGHLEPQSFLCAGPFWSRCRLSWPCPPGPESPANWAAKSARIRRQRKSCPARAVRSARPGSVGTKSAGSTRLRREARSFSESRDGRVVDAMCLDERDDDLPAGRARRTGRRGESRAAPRDLRQAAQRTAANPEAELADRLAAVRVLGRGADGQDDRLRCLAELLAPQTPLELQLAAVETLGRSPNARASELLLSDWTRHGPKVHAAVVAVLLWREPWLGVLQEESANRPELAAAREWALRDIALRHPAAEIRSRAEKLRVPPVTKPEVRKSLDKFLPALNIPGTPSAERRYLSRRPVRIATRSRMSAGTSVPT